MIVIFPNNIAYYVSLTKNNKHHRASNKLRLFPTWRSNEKDILSDGLFLHEPFDVPEMRLRQRFGRGVQITRRHQFRRFRCLQGERHVPEGQSSARPAIGRRSGGDAKRAQRFRAVPNGAGGQNEDGRPEKRRGEKQQRHSCQRVLM